MNRVSDTGKVELTGFSSISRRQGDASDALPSSSVPAGKSRSSLGRVRADVSHECCSVRCCADWRQLQGLQAELTGPLDPGQCGALKECVETVGLAAKPCESQKSTLCFQKRRVSGATGSPRPKHVLVHFRSETLDFLRSQDRGHKTEA